MKQHEYPTDCACCEERVSIYEVDVFNFCIECADELCEHCACGCGGYDVIENLAEIETDQGYAYHLKSETAKCAECGFLDLKTNLVAGLCFECVDQVAEAVV